MTAYTKTTLDAAELASGTAYKLLIGLVVPRPIGWIGTRSATGSRNLAPFSFFNAVAWRPPTVLFSTELVTKYKDTLRNAEATKEFTVNVVTEEVAEAMNVTSGTYPPEIDEFEVAGLTAVEADVVGAPMVAEAKANMECRVTRVVRVGEPASAAVVFGEVVRLHVADDVLDERLRVDPVALKAVGRMAGRGYTTTRDLFFLERPD